MIQNLVILKTEYVKHQKRYEKNRTSHIEILHDFLTRTHVALIAQCAAGENMSHF